MKLERTPRREWLRVNDAKVQVHGAAIKDPSDGWAFTDRDTALMDYTDFLILVDRKEKGGKAPEDTWVFYVVSAEWVRAETKRDWTVFLDQQEDDTGQRKRPRSPDSKQITFRLTDQLRDHRDDWNALAAQAAS